MSCLDAEGFSFVIENSQLIIKKDSIIYANGFVSDGLYLLDLHDKQVMNIDNKRLKLTHSNETLLWHYRLGHINKNVLSNCNKQTF